MSRELSEQETHAWVNRVDDIAYVSTNIPKDKNYWLSKVDDPRVKSVSVDGDVLNLEVLKSALTIRLKTQRVLTDEQREAAAQRLAEIRERR